MTSTIKRCLIVDDDESFRQLISRYLNLILPDVIVEEYDPAVSGTPPLDFDWSGCDLVILDYFLNASLTGLDLLNAWKKQANFPPVIMMTAAGSEDIAVRAMKTGVQDYLRKQNITKERLKQAITDALETRAQEREKRLTNTQSTQSFNKALFYQKLEQAGAEDKANPAFVLIELDQFDEIGEEHGLVMQDDVIRHIAKTTYDAFDQPNYQISMTRIGDAAVGLLLTARPDEALEQELATLKSRLAETPYIADKTRLPFTVSIGAINLENRAIRANDIIRQAREICRQLSDNGGNDIAVFAGNKKQAAPATGHSDDVKPVTAARPATPREKAPAQSNTAKQATTTSADNKPKPTAPAERAEKKQPPSEKDLLEMTLELPAEKLQGKSNSDNAVKEEAAPDILRAINDNRIVQYYQPIMPLSETATNLGKELYAIRVRMVDTDGQIIDARHFLNELKTARNQKLLDRWVLRETVGRIASFMHNKQPSPDFIIKLSDESFADSTLFNWLQNKLMKSLGNSEPGKSLLIEVAADTYLAKQKQVEALFKFLHQSYGLRFALSSFKDVEQLNNCLDKGRFNMYIISQKILADIQAQQSDPTAIPNNILTIKERRGMVISAFIENAANLTQAINCGSDYAMGFFIGEPLDNIGIMSQVESFEIT